MSGIPEGLSPEQKETIDRMTIGEMHDEWKFAPIGAFQSDDPYTEYFQSVMRKKLAADPAGWTRASKDSSR